MGKNTGIAWTDHTWNPWQGCHKVSLGCLNCYMYRDKKRYGQDPETVVLSKAPTFYSPNRWKEPARVFVCSWSDFFIKDVDSMRGVRSAAWDIMRCNQHLTFLILTKRPENIKERLPDYWPLPNVWLGVTVENQEQIKRIITLIDLETSFEKVFISVEPMLGPVEIPSDILPLLDWVICGGESGPGARLMNPAWALSLKNQCAKTRTPFFMKQMTNKAPIPDYLQGREFPK